MNDSGVACETRWNNVRDQYRKALRKSEGRSGQAARSIKSYKFSNKLSFLNDHMTERDTICSLPHSRDVPVVQETVAEATVATIENTEDTVAEQKTGDKSEPCYSSEESTSRRKTDQSASSKLLEYLIKKNETRPSVSDKFFDTIKLMVETLPPIKQSMLCSKIFNLVQECELTALREEDRRMREDNLGESSSTCREFYNNFDPQ
ncbi:uncharacterized protein LOC143187544 [Calliopsis andreniformis]|uniref:uncharacterized protein LOC143187544 n=1 Tax=Calliopsis andreniformis TaxID=337506 RepID=UPI003FCDBF8A